MKGNGKNVLINCFFGYKFKPDFVEISFHVLKSINWLNYLYALFILVKKITFFLFGHS